MTYNTGNRPHGFKVGDAIVLHRFGRWHRLRELLRRPRLQYVSAMTATEFTLCERRMTWGEWRRALWGVIAGR